MNRYLVQDASPVAIISNKSDYVKSHFDVPIVQYEELTLDDLRGGQVLSQGKEEVFAVMYTSGSSGRPKGTRLHFRAPIILKGKKRFERPSPLSIKGF